MNILDMTKEDFSKVPYLNTGLDKMTTDGKLTFKSFVVIPVENEDHKIELHDSGYGCMAFCLIGENNEPIGTVGGGSDVCFLDGIGGYGHDWINRFGNVLKTVPVHAWSFDLLPCGYLNFWTRKPLFITDKLICSSFEVYSEDARA